MDDPVSPFPLSLTCYFTQHNVVKLFKKGEQNVAAILQRLDRLTHDEARTTADQTLEVVHCLVQNMRVVMDSEKARSCCDRSLIDSLSCRWQSIC